jgi:hypothetical protein
MNLLNRDLIRLNICFTRELVFGICEVALKVPVFDTGKNDGCPRYLLSILNIFPEMYVADGTVADDH